MFGSPKVWWKKNKKEKIEERNNKRKKLKLVNYFYISFQIHLF